MESQDKTKKLIVFITIVTIMTIGAVLGVIYYNWVSAILNTPEQPDAGNPVTAAAYSIISAAADKPEPALQAVHIEPVPEAVEVTPAEPDYIPEEEDINALARTIYGEARGVESTMEQAAVAWCVLNRIDAGYADTIEGVCSAPGQFYGYSKYHPVTDEFAELAADVLVRYWREQQGETDIGRVLPREYLYFSGNGVHNRFRVGYRDYTYWDWDTVNPYE